MASPSHARRQERPDPARTGGAHCTVVVLFCRTGNRTAIALKRLRAAGYSSISEVIGGMDGKANALDDDEMGWRAAELPISRFVDPPL